MDSTLGSGRQGLPGELRIGGNHRRNWFCPVCRIGSATANLQADAGVGADGIDHDGVVVTVGS